MRCNWLDILPYLPWRAALALAQTSVGLSRLCGAEERGEPMWRALCKQHSKQDPFCCGVLWARTWRHQFDLRTRTRLYNAKVALFCPTSKGKRLANEFKEKALEKTAERIYGQPSKTFSYGEIPFSSVEALFLIVQRVVAQRKRRVGVTVPSANGIEDPFSGEFVDLGSGTGKMLAAAALLGNFKRCVGIELVPALHEEAVNLMGDSDTCVWKDAIRPSLCPVRAGCTKMHPLCGDLTRIDWTRPDSTGGTKDSQVSFVYACSTMFTPNLMQAIAARAGSLARGAIVVTLTKPLFTDDQLPELKVTVNGAEAKADCGDDSKIWTTDQPIEQRDLRLEIATQLRMTWGPARVFVYSRL